MRSRAGFSRSRCRSSTTRRAFAARSPRRSTRRFFRSATLGKRRIPARARSKARRLFQDVEFLPGPLLDGLFSLNGKTGPTRLEAQRAGRVEDCRPASLSARSAVPIGNLTRFELEGSVGFDRSLDLTASMPILPTKLADRPLLGAIAADVASGSRSVGRSRSPRSTARRSRSA